MKYGKVGTVEYTKYVVRNHQLIEFEESLKRAGEEIVSVEHDIVFVYTRPIKKEEETE